MTPNKAFILAAGLGTRLRPYTDNCPKPLVEVAGRTLLDRTLDHLEKVGVDDVVINTHYLADHISRHLSTRESPKITFSHEETLLDTGGGIKRMINYFGESPFYVLSGDGLWNDGTDDTTLQRLANFWDPEKMDIALLLQPVEIMQLTTGVGDYDVESNGHAQRSADQTGRHMFTSIRINHPRIFENTPVGAFSYLDLMDRAEKQERLYGLIHDGAWHHISTPEDLETVNEAFKKDLKVGT